MNDEVEDFLERHADAIENALLKKQLEEAYAKIDIQEMLTTMKPLPHSGEWIRTVDADGQLKLSYPPGYDDAKDEALRMLDDDRWEFSMWEAKLHFKTRRMALFYFSISIFGLVAINSMWMRFLISVGMLVVLQSYLRYGNPIKNPLARLRGYFRRGVQGQVGRPARDGGVQARPQQPALASGPGDRRPHESIR
jgi:hypothetical protein